MGTVTCGWSWFKRASVDLGFQLNSNNASGITSNLFLPNAHSSVESESEPQCHASPSISSLSAINSFIRKVREVSTQVVDVDDIQDFTDAGELLACFQSCFLFESCFCFGR